MPSGEPAAICVYSRMPGVEPVQRDRVPRGVEGDTFLVADPAHVRSDVAEHRRLRLEIPHQLPRVRPVVIGGAVDLAPLARPAVVAVAAVGAVEPHFRDRAVVGQQLAKLAPVVIEIRRTAVLRVIAIPGREIHAERQAVLLARLGEVADDVSLAVFPGTAFHRMLGELARPQREAVVVLRGDDQPFHAGVARDPGPLPRVERRRVEHALGLVAVAPLLVGERVHREMDEAVELALVPRELARRWDGADWRWRRDGGRPLRRRPSGKPQRSPARKDLYA